MNTVTAIPTIADFESRAAILHSGLPAHENSLLLAEWDRTYPPAQTARDRIVRSGNSAHENAQAISKLPPEKPATVRLLPAERETLADAATKLRTLRESYVVLLSKREKGEQALEQTGREKRRLETSLDFDDVPGIQSLVFITAKLQVTQTWLAGAGEKIKGLENVANTLIKGVDALFTRRFGPSREPGGRWNPGFSALPTRISECVTAIEVELNKK